jgi:hypothetical protein
MALLPVHAALDLLDDRIALTGPALELAGAWGVEPRLHSRGHLTLLFLCASLRRDLAAFVG